MAFPLRNLHLNLSNVARTTNAKSMPVNGTNEIYERDEDGQKTDKLKNLVIDCAGYRGATLSVKFPVEIKEKFDDLKKQLENDVTIEIAFVGLKLTAYSLKANDGTVVSGVSAKADDFTIVKNDADTIDYDDAIL